MEIIPGLDETWQEHIDFLGYSSEGDNSEQLRRASRLLSRVISSELTDRQRECIDLYYFSGLTMPQIADRLGINKSTVSRTIGRAKTRIHRSMKYASLR